jgi:nuclear cap-binding protein subunit 1
MASLSSHLCLNYLLEISFSNSREADLSLPPIHPKRIFLSRVLELEVRLSYHERILSSVPESFYTSNPPIISPTPPSASNPFADPSNPDSSSAEDLLALLKAKKNGEEVLTWLEDFKHRLTIQGQDELGREVVGVEEVEGERRKVEILMSSVLAVGSRSFSHLLNVLER